MRAIELEVSGAKFGIRPTQCGGILLNNSDKILVTPEFRQTLEVFEPYMKVIGEKEVSSLANGAWERVGAVSAGPAMPVMEPSDIEKVSQNRSMADKPRRGKGAKSR